MICGRCNGKGLVEEDDLWRLAMVGILLPGPCDECKGTGKVDTLPVTGSWTGDASRDNLAKSSIWAEIAATRGQSPIRTENDKGVEIVVQAVAAPNGKFEILMPPICVSCCRLATKQLKVTCYHGTFLPFKVPFFYCDECIKKTIARRLRIGAVAALTLSCFFIKWWLIRRGFILIVIFLASYSRFEGRKDEVQILSWNRNTSIAEIKCINSDFARLITAMSGVMYQRSRSE